MRRVLVYLGMLVVLAACGLGEALQDPGDPVDLTPATLAGSWHSGAGRFMIFREDGSFSAVDLPVPAFREFVNSHPFGRVRLDGSGTWTLDHSPQRSTGPQSIVHLAFDNLAGTPARFNGPDLTALRPGDGKVYLVIFYVGEQGNSWTSYLKCESDCPVPSPLPTG